MKIDKVVKVSPEQLEKEAQIYYEIMDIISDPSPDMDFDFLTNLIKDGIEAVQDTRMKIAIGELDEILWQSTEIEFSN